MQFSSWNINGLRAVEKKGFFPQYVAGGDYDMVFLMETKSEIDQLSDAVLHVPAYSFTLQPSTYKKGYAGVGAYVRDYLSPTVQTGWSHDCDLHDEERVLTMSFIHPQHGRIAITGAYFPNGARGSSKRGGDMETKYRVAGEVSRFSSLWIEGGQEGVDLTATSPQPPASPTEKPSLALLFSSSSQKGESASLRTAADFPANLDYKLAFFDEFFRHAQHLRRHHDHVFICGDINIAHNPIDIARPESNKNSIGFLPIERAKLDEWRQSGWVDIFRHNHPDTVQYSWWDVISRARERNVGWRIDSWWCHADSLRIVADVSYETDQMGSDHCPVVLTLQ